MSDSDTKQVVHIFITGEQGAIIVFSGSMYAGKTEALLELHRELETRRTVNEQLTGRTFRFYRPDKDTRTPEITTHDGSKKFSFAIKIPSENPEKILEDVEKFETETGEIVGAVFIDEAWMFEKKIVNVCVTLADRKKIVAVSAMDQYFDRTPVEISCLLMGVANFTIKKQAFCIACKDWATFSFRLFEIWKKHPHPFIKISDPAELVKLGGAKTYCALCRCCYLKIYDLINSGKLPNEIISELKIEWFLKKRELI